MLNKDRNKPYEHERKDSESHIHETKDSESHVQNDIIMNENKDDMIINENIDNDQFSMYSSDDDVLYLPKYNAMFKKKIDQLNEQILKRMKISTECIEYVEKFNDNQNINVCLSSNLICLIYIINQNIFSIQIQQRKVYIFVVYTC